MRIAMVGRYFNRQGGVSRCLAELATRASRAHDVDVYTHEILDVDGFGGTFVKVPMFGWPRSLQGVTFGMLALRKMAGFYDLVHAQGPQVARADFYTAQSCHAAWVDQIRRRAPWSAAASRLYPPHIVLLAWERHCFTHPEAVVFAVSERVKLELVEFLGVSPEQVEVAYSGVDTDAFAPLPGSRPTVRDANGAAPDDVVILFSGYEFARKGLRQLIGAVAAVGDPSLQIWVAGGDRAAPYQEFAEQLGVGSRVRFFGHVRAMHELMAAADLFVFPTAYEPFGLVILEALACGLPVITSRIAGAAELVTERREGFLLEDPSDVEELAAALRIALGDRGRWPSMSRAARELALSHSWETVWQRTEAAYVRRLANAGVSPRAVGELNHSARAVPRTP